MSELLVFYLLFWWLIQIFYKMTSLDKEDCKIKTFVAKFDSSKVTIGSVEFLGLGCLLGGIISFFIGKYDGFLFGVNFFCISWVWYAVKKSKRAVDLIYRLLDCQLCMESHVGFLVSMPISLYYQDIRLLLLGYSAAGLNNIIKRIISTNE